MPIGAIIGGLGNAIIGGLNYAEQKKANEKRAEIEKQNLQFQKENMEYQKKLQQQIFSREDNAIQRQAMDMEAAGLSKNLAAGGGANAGAIVNTQAQNSNSSSIMANQVSGADMLQVAMSLEQQKLIKAQAEKLEADADKTRADTGFTQTMIKSEEQKIELNKALEQAKKEEARLLQQKTLTEKEQQRLIKLQQATTEAEKQLKHYQTSKTIKEEEWYRQQISDAQYNRDKSEKANMRTTDKKDMTGAAWSLGSLVGELLGQ